MPSQSGRARAHPNIAFIKYWGNRDHTLRLPANSSLSMNLAGLYSETVVQFDAQFGEDEFRLNGAAQEGVRLKRVSGFLDLVRGQAGIGAHARVESENNFPSGAGIASSASAFAALALAASAAAGLDLDERALSRLARRGSGSASRSVPGGFVEWHAGARDEDSYAESIAPAEHWDLVDCVAVVSEEHKETGSSDGHRLAESSPLQATRVAGAEERLRECREALLGRDFERFAEVVERDSQMMHAVMMTSKPPLTYWQPPTLAVMEAVRAWRAEGLAVCTTVDAGPNVHAICLGEHAEVVGKRLREVPGVLEVRRAKAGGGAQLVQGA